MNKSFTLTNPELGDLVLRIIEEKDLEHLRIWKNERRESFFFKEIITPEAQFNWFKSLQERPDDYMFVVETSGCSIGCLGFRYVDECVDVYNVIRARFDVGGKGVMSKALRLMCSYALESYATSTPSAKVLRSNPALSWYQQNGFNVVREHHEYVEIMLDLNKFSPCQIFINAVLESKR